MDVAQVLIVIVGLGAAVTTYCLLRFPHMRREQFRHYGAFSVAVSFLGALAVLFFCLLLLITQSAWRTREARKSSLSDGRQTFANTRVAM